MYENVNVVFRNIVCHGNKLKLNHVPYIQSKPRSGQLRNYSPFESLYHGRQRREAEENIETWKTKKKRLDSGKGSRAGPETRKDSQIGQ